MRHKLAIAVKSFIREKMPPKKSVDTEFIKNIPCEDYNQALTDVAKNLGIEEE